MMRLLKIIWKTAKWCFVVFVVLLALAFVGLCALVVRDAPLPASLAEREFRRVAPSNLVLRVGSLSFGFMGGLKARGVSITDLSKGTRGRFLAGADEIAVDPFARRLTLVGAKYPRLPDSYYAPENHEKNARVEAELPRIPKFSLVLERPDILSVRPERVVADVEVTPDRVEVDRIRLDWPDRDERMRIDGSCVVDLARQEVAGSVEGKAKQSHIRPMLVALDVPVSLPYIDGFTDVPCSVPSSCSWKVNLVNNDFDLDLGLHPTLGKYNDVPMKRADGDIHLHVYTRGDWLNYRHVFGPIVGVGPKGEPLEGTVKVSGTNGYNVVEVKAKSALPVANLLRIGGFTGDYVGEDVVGESSCDIEFRFPRSMTNNYEVLNGRGHIEVKDGMLMRMKGFKGLLALLADKVPGVSWFTDSTQASCDYVIEKGVVKTENLYIEGSVFSVKMYGAFDAPRDLLDYTVRVQFTKKDSLVGKILHPLAWPFTKLLLEFHLGGSPSNPEWHYISVIDRVVGGGE